MKIAKTVSKRISIFQNCYTTKYLFVSRRVINAPDKEISHDILF